MSNVAEAQKNAQDFQESQRELGETAEQSAGSMAFLGTILGTTADREEDVADEADQADEQFTLLGATTWALTRALGALGISLGGGSLFAGAVAGAKALAGWIGGALAGGLSTVIGYLSGFVSWLAAGSAAALAVGAAIGAVIGLFGVWILEITGVLDWIGKLGERLSNGLPAWARDGINAVIAVMTGQLAAIGAFIVGTIRGGFDQGFAMAKRVVMIQVGAIRRTIARMAGFVQRQANAAGRWLGNAFQSAKNRIVGIIRDVQEAIDRVMGRLQDMINRAQEAADAVPGSDVAGDVASGNFDPDLNPFASGNQDLRLPSLQTGGTVTGSGIARVHEGEYVGTPGMLADAMGGGGGGVNVENMNVTLNGDFDPSNASRRDIEKFADRLVDAIGDKTNRRSGVR